MNKYLFAFKMCDAKIYLDYNATTPLHKDVIVSIHNALSELWANPSSGNEGGRRAKTAINEARELVGQVVNAPGRDIYFLSGGTEANLMVIHSAIKHFAKWKCNCSIKTYSQSKPHIITTSIEHDAILLPLAKMYTDDVDVTHLKWENLLETIKENIRPSTCLVTVMLANNETGILLPVAKIGKLLKDINKRRQSDGLIKILLHTDAAQAIGKIPVDVMELNVDYLTIVGHKFYGPRIGALYSRSSAPLYAIFFGGGQEREMRSGTENTPMIVGLGVAAAVVNKGLETFSKTMVESRDYLEKKLKDKFQNFVKINCIEPCYPSSCDENYTSKSLSRPQIERLPNTSSISFNYKEVTGVEILKRCQILEASTGAACHSSDKPKSILEACGVCPFHAVRTIRLSVGRENTLCEIDSVVEDLANAIKAIMPKDMLKIGT